MQGALLFKGRQSAKKEREFTDTAVYDRVAAATLPGESRVQMIFMLSPDEITPNPAQPRRFFTEDAILHLADSIRLHGMIQPLTVRKNEAGKYELVAGERRLRAAKRLGMEKVPCVPVEADSRESANMAIVENIQRENLNMFEQAEAIATLMQVHCLTQEKIAQELSCSQSYVANKLRLLKISDSDKEEILSANLTERHVRALLRIKEPEKRRSAMHTVIRREMNVAASEEYIDGILAERRGAPHETGKEKNTRIFLKDIKILYNTIDRAVEAFRLSGMNIETQRLERADGLQIVITVPKGRNQG